MSIEDAVQKGKEIYEKAKKDGLPEGANLIQAITALCPYVSMGMSLVNCFMPEEPQLTLGQVLNTLQSHLKQIDAKFLELASLLKEMARITDDRELRRDQGKILDTARSALSAAKDWDSVRENKNISDQEKRELREKAIELTGPMETEMRSFLNDDFYMHVYIKEYLYKYNYGFEESGFPPAFMKPDDCPQGDIGIIWDYGWMLPAFLEVIADYLIVFQILWPEDFHARFINRPQVRENFMGKEGYAEKLWEIHNRIRKNIKEIPEHCDNRNNFVKIWSKQHAACWFNVVPWPCGAVECYTATASIEGQSTELMVPWDPSPRIPSDDEPEDIWNEYYQEWPRWWDRYILRWRIKSYRRRVDLYHEVGLPCIWDTINNLRALMGQPALELSEYAREEGFRELKEFSLRKVLSFIPESMTTGRELSERPVSLRELQAMLKSPPPISLRAILDDRLLTQSNCAM